jgi:nucleotide-binding universal stress UspA family protein
MTKRVLVLLDPARNERLLPWLRRVLGGPPGDVYLLSVRPPLEGVMAGQHRVAYAHQAEEAARAATLVHLSPAASRLADEGFRVATDVRFGDPAGTTLRTADEVGASLIVLAVSAGRGWRRWWSRGADHEILRRARVPVLAVRRHGQRAA